MGLFGAAHEWGWKKGSFPKICHTYPTMMKFDSCTLPKDQKYVNHMTQPMSSADYHFFTGNQCNFCYKEIQI